MVLFCCLLTGCSNIHEVTPGVLYRSAQLSGSRFDRLIQKYRIKTVINLRGASTGAKWYQDEVRVMQMDGVTHLDISLSAVRYVSARKIDSIMQVASSATKPILVHCQGGADRSSLFCAAWRLKCENASVENSSRQLSFVFGHVPFFLNRTQAMDSSFHDYARFLGYRPITSGGKTTWSTNH